jgi:large subunit ribosomal protein L28
MKFKKGNVKMSKVCYFTGRKTVSGNNRSHAMNQTKRTVKPNLQKVKIVENGKVKTVRASAKALKKLPAAIERV